MHFAPTTKELVNSVIRQLKKKEKKKIMYPLQSTHQIPPHGSLACCWLWPLLFSSYIHFSCLATVFQFLYLAIWWGGILPHFISASIPWLSSRFASSETFFQSSFWDTIVRHPHYIPSSLEPFNIHVCHQFIGFIQSVQFIIVPHKPNYTYCLPGTRCRSVCQ